MLLELFKGLKSLNIDDDKATDIVKAMDAHIDNRIAQATQPLLQELRGVKTELGAKIDAYAHIKRENDVERDRRSSLVRWVIGTGIAAVGATLGVLKLLGFL